MSVTFDTIGMHPWFHLDEAFGYLLLVKRGEKKFPGISQATILFDGTGGRNFQGINGDELLKEGCVLLGIGGGMFDEHGGSGKEGECTSSLVAKYLEIDKEPGLLNLLKFVKDTDLKPVAQPFDLSSTLKDVHEVVTPQEAMKWATIGLLGKWRAQEEFCEAEKTVLTAAQVDDLLDPYGKIFRMITAVTDNNKFKDAARRKGVALIVQKTSKGNVQIFADHQRINFPLDAVCEGLRLEEQRMEGEVKITDPRILRSVGKLEDIQAWFYHANRKMLLNGSLAHPDVFPTKIPLEIILEIVRAGVKKS